MNLERLREAERRFMERYPGGFSHPFLQELVKKHRVEKMKKLARDSFGPQEFADPRKIADAMLRTVSQSSLVSVFEKPRFRDAVHAMNDSEKIHLARGLGEFLHGDQAAGFGLLTGLLQEYKIAKWPLLTVIPVYYRPETEVLIKPTTVKKIIGYFELTGLQYRPAPEYPFYRAYREQILAMRQAAEFLTVDNTAFCGFLMMATEGQ